MSDTKPGRRAVTSHDVAKLAGVSRAAVSRSFTPNASVSPQTRDKVHKAASELGYRVNYLARSLINQRSDLVGLVVAGMDNPFRTMQIDHLSRALLAHDFRPILLPTSGSEDVGAFIEHLLQYSVSGVVVTSDAPPTALCEECAANRIPIVLINKGDDIAFVDRVVNDDKAAGRMAAELLIENGARRPAVMAAPHVSYSARRRQDAFVAHCAVLGVKPDILAIAINDYHAGFEAAGAIAGTNIDGIFCVNDYLACGVVDRLAADQVHRKTGPIAVIGHDNIPQASWHGYQLTTFAQPCDVQAETAITLLESRMEDPAAVARVQFTPVSLIRRRTA
tara:strand:- start:2 stop:1006 length:1005 start_codon:yes stop_codon:yes gene_type:complete